MNAHSDPCASGMLQEKQASIGKPLPLLTIGRVRAVGPNTLEHMDLSGQRRDPLAKSLEFLELIAYEAPGGRTHPGKQY